jgi:hypothetical protein
VEIEDDVRTGKRGARFCRLRGNEDRPGERPRVATGAALAHLTGAAPCIIRTVLAVGHSQVAWISSAEREFFYSDQAKAMYLSYARSIDHTLSERGCRGVYRESITADQVMQFALVFDAHAYVAASRRCSPVPGRITRSCWWRVEPETEITGQCMPRIQFAMWSRRKFQALYAWNRSQPAPHAFMGGTQLFSHVDLICAGRSRAGTRIRQACGIVDAIFHITWAAKALGIAAWGPGVISIDQLLASRRI